MAAKVFSVFKNEVSNHPLIAQIISKAKEEITDAESIKLLLSYFADLLENFPDIEIPLDMIDFIYKETKDSKLSFVKKVSEDAIKMEDKTISRLMFGLNNHIKAYDSLDKKIDQKIIYYWIILARFLIPVQMEGNDNEEDDEELDACGNVM